MNNNTLIEQIEALETQLKNLKSRMGRIAVRTGSHDVSCGAMAGKRGVKL